MVKLQLIVTFQQINTIYPNNLIALRATRERILGFVCVWLRPLTHTLHLLTRDFKSFPFRVSDG